MGLVSREVEEEEYVFHQVSGDIFVKYMKTCLERGGDRRGVGPSFMS